MVAGIGEDSSLQFLGFEIISYHASGSCRCVRDWLQLWLALAPCTTKRGWITEKILAHARVLLLLPVQPVVSPLQMIVSIMSTFRCLSVWYWRNTWHVTMLLQLTPGSIASRRRRVVDIRLYSVVQVGRSYTSDHEKTVLLVP